MTHAPVRFRQRLTRNAALASGVLLRVAAGVLPAHEGHTPLPSEGGAVAVAKGFIRLSRKQSWAVLLGVFLLLWKCLNSWVAAAMVLLINIPLAALGSVVALLLINRPDHTALDAAHWWQWPQAWASATTLSVAHWVGFITLIGIVSRNGIMMIAHYIHIQKEEGEAFGDAMIVRGTLERLAPVLMTALTAIIGLIPLALGAGETGKEILHPLAIVVIGGLIDATIMDQIVTPAAFKLFGRYVYRKPDAGADNQPAVAWDDAWLHEPAAVPVNRLEAVPTPMPLPPAPVVAVVPDAPAVPPPPSTNGTGAHVP